MNDSNWVHREAMYRIRFNHHCSSGYRGLANDDRCVLTDGALPEDKYEAQKIKTKVTHFSFIYGILYRWLFNSPYAHCLVEQQAAYILREIHEGECDNYSGGRSLCNKAKRQSYYWLPMLADSEDTVKRYEKCQWHPPIIHKRAE